VLFLYKNSLGIVKYLPCGINGIDKCFEFLSVDVNSDRDVFRCNCFYTGRVKLATFQHFFLLLTNLFSVIGRQTGFNCRQFSLRIFSI